jgi:hypothetical protein
VVARKRMETDVPQNTRAGTALPTRRVSDE